MDLVSTRYTVRCSFHFIFIVVFLVGINSSILSTFYNVIKLFVTLIELVKDLANF